MIQVYDKYGKIKSSGLPGSGTVTSFSAGNLSPLFTSIVTSPTSTPNISFSKISQSQNLFYASPNGSSGVPTFRALVATDIPTLTNYVPTSRTLTINGITYDLAADRTWTISSATNLGYTPSPINGIVTSDTGTDATIPLADGTNAGLLTPAEKTIIAGSQAYADAKVADSITDGVTTIAPSQNAVFDALALKQSASTRRNANNSTDNDINYCGVALGTGISESALVWTITRLTIASDGTITTATATNVAWTDREIIIYT